MNFIMNTIRSLAYVITDPYYLIILLVLGVILYIKNKKIVIMNTIIIGESDNTSLELTLSQIVIGILAGIVASVIFTASGIVFSETSGIQILFIISIFLAFIKPKYICFSYSGAILGLLSIIFRYNGISFIDLDITILMSFIAILHIIEAFLIALDGKRGAIAVFSEKEGIISGGYAFKRNWLVLVAVFIALPMKSAVGVESIAEPSWWPLISTSATINLFSTMAIMSMPFWCIIGYSTVTFTKNKRQKTLHSALCVFVFGILLLAISNLAKLGIAGEIFVIIYAPLSHELMLRVQSFLEEKKDPIFVSDDEGFCVLDVVKKSKAYYMGFEPQDKIISINGGEILSEVQIYKMNKIKGTDFLVRKRDGTEKHIVVSQNTKDRIGMLIVPKRVDTQNTVKVNKESFSSILDKLKDK